MRSTFRTVRQGACAMVAAAALVAAAPAAAWAQEDPNPGAITFTGGLDVPSVYMFRGILQETEPKLTLWPYGDIGIALTSGDGAIKSVGVNVGVWNSLHTGNAGSDGPTAHAHYEEDFYATLNLGFGGGVGVGVGYMALTSPNGMFDTVKELQIKVTKAHMLNPFGFLAIELEDAGQADGGNGILFAGGKKGTYLELGVAPSWALGGSKITLAIPAKVGLSVSHYYEIAPDEDNAFGFFDIGGQITVPLGGVPSRFGAWNIHGGADVLVLGDTTQAINKDQKRSKVVGLIGIGVGY